MSNSKQIQNARNLTSLPQRSAKQRNYNYIQHCESSLVGDPLLIPKQEIALDQSSSSNITLSGIRQTVAEVFIEPFSASTAMASSEGATNNIPTRAWAKNAELTGHRGMHNVKKETVGSQDTNRVLHNELFDETGADDKEFVSHGSADIRLREKENNNDNGNQILQDTYRCGICDDVCTDKMEFEQHLEFHQELHKSNDEHTDITKMVTVKKTLLVSENASPITNSSQTLQTVLNITSISIDETNNSIRGEVAEAAALDIPSSSENVQTCRSFKSIEESSTASLLPKAENTTTTIVPVEISSSSVPNTAVKSLSSKSARKKKAHSSQPTNKINILEALKENLKLPRIPIRKCDCRLKKLSTKCEFCKKQPKYVCENCKKDFKSYPKLKEHFADAHKYAKYFCQECGRGYDRTSTLKRHIDRHKNLFACYLCTSSFNQKHELEQHIVTHRIKCDQCDKICRSKSELSSHKLEVHKGVTYTCRDCNKTFNKYYLLNSHKIRHHRVGEYTCKQCGKIYMRLSTYNEHLHRHRQKKQVICEECGKQFQSVLNLKRHQSVVHSKKKKYVCNVCKKEFSTVMGRINCQNKHAGIAKYKCDTCEKAYFYAGSLVIHKRIHTGEKPYICIVCSRRFYSSQMLLKHCLSHGIPVQQIKHTMKVAYQPEKQK